MNIAGLTPPSQTAQYLRTLPAIRERCTRVHELAKQGKLEYFDYNPEKEKDVAEYCAGLLKRDYPDFASINPHGRWRHLDFGQPRIQPLLTTWSSSPSPPSSTETTKRILDLFIVSVLLDAGAGNAWSYTEPSSTSFPPGTGATYTRSEGLGVASVHMFTSGLFSSVPDQPFRVDAEGLEKLTVEKMKEGFQVSDENPMVGLEGRTGLLIGLGKALRENKEFFGEEGRPGNMIDFLSKQTKANSSGTSVLPVSALWHVLIEGLNPIWPSRIQFGGISLGDVWPCDALKVDAGENAPEGDNLVPFHKLTQWITYSLIEVLEKVAGWNVDGKEDLTGLPEYRNGGLLIDLGVLTLKPNKLPIDPKSGLPSVEPSHPAIVEWRAMTVVELDRILTLLHTTLSISPSQLSLAQVLEGATWKGGREIAKEKRPSTGGPPVEILSDGTVF